MKHLFSSAMVRVEDTKMRKFMCWKQSDERMDEAGTQNAKLTNVIATQRNWCRRPLGTQGTHNKYLDNKEISQSRSSFARLRVYTRCPLNVYSCSRRQNFSRKPSTIFVHRTCLPLFRFFPVASIFMCMYLSESVCIHTECGAVWFACAGTKTKNTNID